MSSTRRRSTAEMGQLAVEADIQPLFHPEDVTVQQRTDASCWHRRAVGGLYTACGQLIASRFPGHGGSMRSETYTGELCREGCFSPFELSLSDRANEQATRKDGDSLK